MIDRGQLRFCLAIACDKRKGRECGVDECIHPDKAKALDERRAALKEVLYGKSIH